MFSPLRRILVLMPCLLALTSMTAVSVAQQLCTGTTPCVTTWHDDNNRTGWQQDETLLTAALNQPGTVNQGTFGLRYHWTVSGSMYAQPLAVAGVQTDITGCQPCDLIFVATEQDMLYAFNATSSSQNPVWSLNLGTPVYCANPPANFMICNDKGSSIVGPYIGVTGTPVIDTDALTLYVVAAVEIPTDSPPPPPASYVLFAVDITSGAIKASTAITGSVPGLAPPKECKTSSGQGTVTFDVNHLQRPALLLLGSGSSAVVYVGFVSGPVEDVGEFNNGWLFGYNLSEGSLTQTAIFNTTPNGTGGGIWQSGAGPASDGNYIYLATGNGTFDLAGVQNPSIDAGDTLLQLNPSNFAVHGYYTPSDVFSYDNNSGRCTPPNDEDFGSGGVSLPPSGFTYNTMNVVINADKESNLYVANRSSLGGFNLNGGNNLQTVQTPLPLRDSNQGYWASPAYWKYTTGNTTNYMLYYSATDQDTGVAPLPVNGYPLLTSGTSGPISSTYLSTNTLFCYPSPTPSVSSNGTASGTGIVWAIENQNSGNPTSCPLSGIGNAALHAFNATTLAELYNSRAVTTIGRWTSFSTPTIFKGQVYMGTQTEVDVFGICTSCPH